MEQADLIVADGMPLVWASRLRGTPLPERVAGSTMCVRLAQDLARDGRSLYLLGGNRGVAERAGKILADQYPGLRIAGTFCPEFGFEKEPAKIEEIRERLKAAQPDVVYVALGSPKQEELIARLRPDFPKTWWMGVGIGLSFITGDVHRAPMWMQNVGLEWVHRLAQEPRRLASRYLVAGIPFAIELLAVSGWQGIRGRQ
jgi:N-acetylglucosaminyldiphosphoundecaprenol N-acetyl-beta-D-mannosaminyltransferase